MAIIADAGQGSILRHDVWNVFYVSLLRTELAEEAMVSYVDNFSALIPKRDLRKSKKINK